MGERIELVHRRIDLGYERALVRSLSKQAPDDLEVPCAKGGGRIMEDALFAGRGAPSALEQRVGDAGEGGNDDDGARVLGARDLDGVGDRVGIGERRAAELVDGYRGQLREAGNGKRETGNGKRETGNGTTANSASSRRSD
jgi:hypothetical protein